jgi:hypothetical protein
MKKIRKQFGRKRKTSTSFEAIYLFDLLVLIAKVSLLMGLSF